ncbi:MAG: hypothetical protein E7616_07575 [Ruminococcaceae bacterium]|nr:hypothetical protein [Oscillospiraceae bacterium]
MKTKKEKLLLIAGTVWGLAGVNILRIGIVSLIKSFGEKNHAVFALMLLIAAMILTGFLIMFRMVVKRNTKRILSYPEKKSVFAFLDAKGYLLMLFMMGLGIVLRSFDLLPNAFFAVFYTGLGTALTLAGGMFIYNYFSTPTKETHK